MCGRNGSWDKGSTSVVGCWCRSILWINTGLASQSLLAWHLINNRLTSWSILDQHLSRQWVESWLVTYVDTPSSGNWYIWIAHQTTKDQPAANQSRANWDVECRSRCQLSVDWSRVLIKTLLQSPLVHMVYMYMYAKNYVEFGRNVKQILVLFIIVI